MVTEHIKRNYRKGYDENEKLVYKVRVDEDAPEVVAPPAEPEALEEVVADNTLAATEDY